MTHRNVELQIALPKVTEVTKIQQQLQHQHLNQQSSFELAMQTKVEKEASRPNQTDENRAVADGHSHSGQSAQQQSGNHRPRQDSSHAEPPHPFKGKHVDIRL